MQNIKLDKRLKTIYDLVREHSKITDIGADHGYLISKLIVDKKCLYGNCVDINSKCLEKAQTLAKQYNIYNKINFLISDGLTDISEEKTDDIVIAGMGSELIINIIDKCKWLKKNNNKHIILQPMTKPWILRNYLYSNGFTIKYETVVKSKKFFYVIILSEFCGTKRQPSLKEIFTGILPENITSETKDYFYYLSKKFEEIAQKILIQNKNTEKYKYYKNISEIIFKIIA